MKVLPSNLDDFNDIEKIGNEFYFRNDEADNVVKSIDVDNTLSTGSANEPQATASTHNSQFRVDGIDGSAVGSTTNEFDNNALREARSTLGYDNVRNGKLITINHGKAYSTPVAPTTRSHQANTDEAWENEFLPPNTNIFETVTLDEADNVVGADDQKSGKIQADNMRTWNADNELTVINTNRADAGDWDGDDDYDSLEDYSVEVSGPRTARRNRIRLHTSYQKTAIRQPMLQQGFIMSPGYPKYYINMNCSWRVSVPSGQRIRLILLDVHLRCNVTFCCVNCMRCALSCMPMRMAANNLCVFFCSPFRRSHLQGLLASLRFGQQKSAVQKLHGGDRTIGNSERHQ